MTRKNLLKLAFCVVVSNSVTADCSGNEGTILEDKSLVEYITTKAACTQERTGISQTTILSTRRLGSYVSIIGTPVTTRYYQLPILFTGSVPQTVSVKKKLL